MDNHNKTQPKRAIHPLSFLGILIGTFTNSTFWILLVVLEGLHILSRMGVL